MAVPGNSLSTHVNALDAHYKPVRFDGRTATGTVHRAVRVLAALAEANGMVRVSELADQLGLAPSTTHRLLNLLKKEGLVQSSHVGHCYSAGPELLRIASRVIASVEITQLAGEFMNRIAERFGETVVLGSYLSTYPALSFAVRVDGSHALQYRLPMHQPLSLLRGASGKSILAFLPEDMITRAWAVEHTTTGGTAALPSHTAVMHALRRIRRYGFAITEGERLSGAQGVAAPIFNASGIVGCLCITAPKGRMSKALALNMAHELMKEAAALSHLLGAAGDTAVVA